MTVAESPAKNLYGARRFEGRTVVVTGAGHGIGRASALRFCAEGASVAIMELNPDLANETLWLCRAAGGTAEVFIADVGSELAVEQAGRAVLKAFGQVDVVHNNAGFLRAGTVLNADMGEWDTMFAVNVKSILFTSRQFIPGMIERRGGAIINTGSISGLAGDAMLAGYDATKGAVIQLTRQMTADFTKHGIRVNCVCPGWVKTGFNDPQFEADASLDEDELVLATVPLGRQAAPDDIAAAVCFLASDDASYIAGQTLVVDGGLLAV